ncbi:hypothetical protein [Taylorella equigenitalis]|uniref:Uncharacterized protein n=2 Tax=Taylorella equigenitalis TaxID=29575 RepID=A0A654KFW3_TAYEM|nr:hypothetical protein [Taylorella equigenitalis]ADU91328.1 hypothetical protein TEQUI_0383 [Taylorella equigenitalis MCE9]AFN36423.1 hypothetical protein KUI_1373 [Taylorella equigenitalis ATCC 35865]ASY30992.1 hypothetical protein B9Z30_06485 [Taylorella equigenitalis]ASY39824.1 hypothetical protein CA604_06905 [Taylorella equigenitalis]ASY41270.1 hypothetical protein CAV20_06340 [Taylorella equigenitalis]
MTFEIKDLSSWLSTDGATLKIWEQSQLEDLLKNTFGYQSIQIGLSDHNYISQARTQNKFFVDIDYIENFQESDLVVLPHTLELVSNPKMIFQIATSLLSVHGIMVVIGFKTSFLTKFNKKSRGCPVSNDIKIPQSRIKKWAYELDLESKGILKNNIHNITAPSYFLALKHALVSPAMVGSALPKKKSIKSGLAVLNKEKNNV